MGKLDFGTYYDGYDRLRKEGMPLDMLDAYDESAYKNWYGDMDPRIMRAYGRQKAGDALYEKYPYTSWVNDADSRDIANDEARSYRKAAELKAEPLPQGYGRVGVNTGKTVSRGQVAYNKALKDGYTPEQLEVNPEIIDKYMYKSKKARIQQAGNLGTPTKDQLTRMIINRQIKNMEGYQDQKGSGEPYLQAQNYDMKGKPTGLYIEPQSLELFDKNGRQYNSIGEYKQNIQVPKGRPVEQKLSRVSRQGAVPPKSNKMMGNAGKAALVTAGMYGASALSDYYNNGASALSDYYNNNDKVYDPYTGEYVPAMWNPEVEAWVPKR